jgi:heme-degrading monooxygenase HmoA
MIVEQAEFAIVEGREEEFERTMMVAREVIARSPGFVSVELARGIERPSVYLLRVHWRAVDDHMRGFRESELYKEWSSLVRPFFAGDPKVEHFEPRIAPFKG